MEGSPCLLITATFNVYDKQARVSGNSPTHTVYIISTPTSINRQNVKTGSNKKNPKKGLQINLVKTGQFVIPSPATAGKPACTRTNVPADPHSLNVILSFINAKRAMHPVQLDTRALWV